MIQSPLVDQGGDRPHDRCLLSEVQVVESVDLRLLNSSGRSAPRTGGGAPSSQASAVAARHPVRQPGVDLEGRKPPWWSGSRNPGVQKIERPIENRRSATGNPDPSTAANREFQASGNSGFQDFLPNDAGSGRLFSTSTLQRIRNAANRNREL